jgi:hypothetical protein
MALADPPFAPPPTNILRRATLTLVAALVAAALVVYGAFTLLDLASRHTFDVRVGYAGVSSLKLNAGTGDVHLTSSPTAGQVVVVMRVTEGLSTPRRQAVRDHAGALALSSSCSTVLGTECGVDYTISVPPGIPVNAEAGDGDLEAQDLNTTAQLRLSSGDGDVTALRIAAGNVSLESGNGDVTAQLTQPALQLTATSGNGDVTLTVPNTSYAVHASSGNGAVSDQTLMIDPSSPRKISASSGNGDVTITAAGR